MTDKFNIASVLNNLTHSWQTHEKKIIKYKTYKNNNISNTSNNSTKNNATEEYLCLFSVALTLTVI